MTLTTESSTPPRPTVGTDVSVTFLVGPATEVRVTDVHHPAKDIVGLHFDDARGRAAIQGDLESMQRWVDDAAHQLMLASSARAAVEEERADQDRAHAKAHVARLRDTITRERAEAREALG